MHEVGSIVEGKVTGITKFGAFVELDDGTVGMVHISEVSQTYVNDISEHLKENQEVKVKILAVNDDKKISLSIKKALPQQPRNNNGDNRNFNRDNNGNNRNFNRNNNGDNRNFNRDNNGNNRNFNRDNNGDNRNFNRNNNGDNKNFNRDNNGNNRNFNRDNNGDNRNSNRDNNNNRNFNRDNNGNNKNFNRDNNNNRNFNRNAATTPKGPEDFENMLSKFMSTSEDKMSGIKKPSSNRRGGHSSKHSKDYN